MYNFNMEQLFSHTCYTEKKLFVQSCLSEFPVMQLFFFWLETCPCCQKSSSADTFSLNTEWRTAYCDNYSGYQAIYLSTRLPTTILSSLLKASVPVRPDHAVIETCAIYEAHSIFCICPCIVSTQAGVKVCCILFCVRDNTSVHSEVCPGTC